MNVVHCPASRIEFDSVNVSVGVFTVIVSTAEFADTAIVEWSVTCTQYEFVVVGDAR